MTQEKGIPYRRHKPSAALREFLDPLDPGAYFDCGQARLHGLDEALLREAKSRGRRIGDDSFQLVATDMGLIFCRPSISFAIAARWEEVTLIRPHGDDPVVLPITWPTHGELKFTVSKRLAGNVFRRWLQLRMQAERLTRQEKVDRFNRREAESQIPPDDWEVVTEVKAATRPERKPGTAPTAPDRRNRVPAPGRGRKDHTGRFKRRARRETQPAANPNPAANPSSAATSNPAANRSSALTANPKDEKHGQPRQSVGPLQAPGPTQAPSQGPLQAPGPAQAPSQGPLQARSPAQAPAPAAIPSSSPSRPSSPGRSVPAGTGAGSADQDQPTAAEPAIGPVAGLAAKRRIIGQGPERSMGEATSGSAIVVSPPSARPGAHDKPIPPFPPTQPLPPILPTTGARTVPPASGSADPTKPMAFEEPTPIERDTGRTSVDSVGAARSGIAAGSEPLVEGAPASAIAVGDDSATDSATGSAPGDPPVESDDRRSAAPTLSGNGDAPALIDLTTEETDSVSGDAGRRGPTAGIEAERAEPALGATALATPTTAVASLITATGDAGSLAVDRSAEDVRSPGDAGPGDAGPGDADSALDAAPVFAKPVLDEGPVLGGPVLDAAPAFAGPLLERVSHAVDEGSTNPLDHGRSPQRLVDHLGPSPIRTIERPPVTPPSWVGSPVSLVGVFVVVSTFVLIGATAVSSYRRGVDRIEGATPVAAMSAEGVNTTVNHRRFNPTAGVTGTGVNATRSTSRLSPAAGAAGADGAAGAVSLLPDGPRLCNSNYSGCVPDVSDVDCPNDGDGPLYSTEPAVVMGDDVYGLDTDEDGETCEPDQPRQTDLDLDGGGRPGGDQRLDAGSP